MMKIFTLNLRTAAIVLLLACGAMPSWAQSGTCISGLVENKNSSIWSEECYLKPNCAIQGNPCQANDVRMLGSYAAGLNGGAIPVFGPGDTVPLHIYGTFYNRTATDRFSVRTRTEFYVGNAFRTELNQCSFDVMASGTNSYRLLTPIQYVYGQTLSFRNSWVAWATSAGQCSTPSAPRFDDVCGEYPPAKCSRGFGPADVLISNFSYTCGSSTPTTRMVCFQNLTTGGTPPYTYSWNFGDGSAVVTSQNSCHIFSGITSPDTVKLTVTDAAGVKSSSFFVVNLQTLDCPCNTPLAITATAALGGCSSTTGSVSTVIAGGTGPFHYQWNTGDTTASLNGVPSGTYSVTVTTSAGCIGSDTAVLNQPAPIAISSIVTPVACNGGFTGAIDITVTGGTAPFTYGWDISQSTEDVSGLRTGTYTVIVTDARGCTATRSDSIGESSLIVATASAQNVSCFGFANGSVSLTVSGGNLPYSYVWSNGDTTAGLTGIRQGSYRVTITDATGCTKLVTAIVGQPGPLTLGSIPTAVSCFNGANGSINLTVFGGTPGYTYAWSNAAVTQDIAGLTAGSYEVTVQDANSCSATVSVNVSQPTQMQLTADVVESCFGLPGAIDLSVNGGTATYTYRWSTQATTEDIVTQTGGTYSVTVTDRNGCTATATFEDDGSDCGSAPKTSLLDLGGSNNDNSTEKDNLKVYPVPTKESVNVEINTEARNIEVIVFDIQGRIMKAFKYQNSESTFKTELNLKGIVAPGQYFIQVTADGQEQVKKVTLMP